MTAAVDIDARGLRCPWPALRLARAMREHDVVTLTADDPAAPGEITALAEAQGWRLVRNGVIFHVMRNASFTSQL